MMRTVTAALLEKSRRPSLKELLLTWAALDVDNADGFSGLWALGISHLEQMAGVDKLGYPRSNCVWVFEAEAAHDLPIGRSAVTLDPLEHKHRPRAEPRLLGAIGVEAVLVDHASVSAAPRRD
jgi:hypothetical protein